MSASPEPVLFEAVCTPPRSLTPRAFRVLAVLLIACAAVPALLFLLLGAWPVLGFLGGEVALVLSLVALQARGARRVSETLVLTRGGLTISRTDHRGRRQTIRIDPYWARLGRDAGGRPALLQRDRSTAIGLPLAEEEREALADALAAALARWRRPDFDNPQLR
ncbi:DUF2244 domain-containing protein [Plastoroseomonas hellenica]|uniref:DUF2244 domain-containing protein n=1 Tax=Plastoroseomonas hellenica TaxID=2687306 RepID=A0ABS5F5U3_9PROT|nr:DUF2244 domain-containing protein [Plastoroseomonas hellenica]MBR0646537.1 DUF2244 domain-containing protein [Plastoroseomonas hellenica]MBR0667500.1 DUF2244 domain-containing protein [Plastoroseomonas hellenica]